MTNDRRVGTGGGLRRGVKNGDRTIVALRSDRGGSRSKSRWRW